MSNDKLAQALRPFVRTNSSDEFITLKVRTIDIAKARQVLADYEAEKQTEEFRCEQRRDAAEATLFRLGYTWAGGVLWKPPLGEKPAWAGGKAEKQAGAVAGQASAPAPEHVPVSPEREAAIDAASGLVLLPPIRVTAEVYAELKAASEASGLIVQAVVRDRLSQAPAVAHDTAPPSPLAEQAGTAVKPPKHKFWGAGEADCPADLKAPNGELHSRRCKVCGETNPRDQYCWNAAPLAEQDKEDAERYRWLRIRGGASWSINGGPMLATGLHYDAAVDAARAKKEQS